jgi:hypothetical protein
MGCARTATPSAPLSRDIPWPAHSFSTFAQKLSVGPESREGARKWRFLGGKPLLVPHGGARTARCGAHPHRCAALDARLAGFLCAAERVLLARAAGPFARCALSLRTILGWIDAYSSRCARGCAACCPSMSQRGARSPRARDPHASVHSQTVSDVREQYSGVCESQAVILGVLSAL